MPSAHGSGSATRIGTPKTRARGRDQAALDHDRDQHDHEDDVVDLAGAVSALEQHVGAEQDRDRALEPAEQHERALTRREPDRQQHQPARPAGRTTTHEQRRRARPPTQSRSSSHDAAEVDRQPEDDERHDLGQAGERAGELLDLPLVRRPLRRRPGRPATKTARKPDPSRLAASAVQHQRERHRLHRVERRARQRHPPHQLQQQPAADAARRRPRRPSGARSATAPWPTALPAAARRRRAG